MTSTPDRIRELTQGMWKKKLFVVLWHGKGADLLPRLADHLEYMIDLERQGKIFASGPLDFGRSSDGMTILRAETEEEARTIASRDPFVVNGVRTFDIREWLVMEGSLAIKVNYSDRSIDIT